MTIQGCADCNKSLTPLRSALTDHVISDRTSPRSWLVAVLVVFGFSSTSPASDALSPDREKTSTAAAIREDIVLGAAGLVLLPEHLFMTPATAVTRDCMRRMAVADSPYHAAYLQYREGKISRAELIGRLPHVAMIGDSLSKNAFISSIPTMLWRTRTSRRHDWFLDTDPAPGSIESVFERLEKITPLVATEYSGVGATVDSGKTRANFYRRLVRTENFSGQVNRLLAGNRFPDLILIWIGHNNLDWAVETPVAERAHPDKRLRAIAHRVRLNYEVQARRLIERATAQRKKTAIVVFGLVNFDAFFKARARTEAIHARDAKSYPYLEVDYRHYLSMRPAYRNNMIKLALLVNDELAQMVDQVRTEFRSNPNVQIRYSSALARVDISAAENLHRSDAWHPSVKGHSLLAGAAFRGLSPSLKFLGMAGGKN